MSAISPEDKYGYLKGKILPSSSVTNLPSYRDFYKNDKIPAMKLLTGDHSTSHSTSHTRSTGSEELDTLKFMGLYAQTIQIGNQNPYIDVFGYLENGLSAVVRIRCGKPSFLCKVPPQQDPLQFIQLLQGGLAAKEVNPNEVTFTVEQHYDSRRFHFGRKTDFIRISSNKFYGASKLKDVAKDAYSVCLDEIKETTVIDGPYHTTRAAYIDAMIDKGEAKSPFDYKFTSNSENDNGDVPQYGTEYPLRYTTSMSNSMFHYNWMATHHVALTGYLVIKNYTIVDQGKEWVRVKAPYLISVSEDNVTNYDPEEQYLNFAVEASIDTETGNVDWQPPVKPTPENPDPVQPISRFSDPNYDPFVTIGCVFSQFGVLKPFLKVGFAYEDKIPLPVADALIISCKNEKDMLDAITKLLDTIGFDLLVTFNGETFDNKYIEKRAFIHGINIEMHNRLSMYREIRKKSMAFEFLPNQTFKADGIPQDGLDRFECDHRSSFDAMIFFKGTDPKNFSERWGLDYMLRAYNVTVDNQLVQKRDMDFNDMYRIWYKEYSPEGVNTIIHYCIEDCACTHYLINSQRVYQTMFEFANATFTTFKDALHKANGFKVSCVVPKYAHELGYAFMDETPPLSLQRYPTVTIEGGEVKSLAPGHQEAVTGVDFKSQYPAQTIANNIDTCAKVPCVVVNNLEGYGLHVLRKDTIKDCYGTRSVMYVCRKSDMEECKQLIEVAQTLKLSRFNILWVTHCEKQQKKYGATNMAHLVYKIEEYKTTYTDVADHDVEEKVYLVQSPKDINGKPLIHFAVMEVMLTQLWEKRDQYKALMKKAKKELEKLDKHSIAYAVCEAKIDRFNAIQLAQKVLMNSIYGVKNSSLFSIYDPEGGGVTTWCSRMIIAFLRKVLETNFMMIPKRVFDVKKLEKPIKHLMFRTKEVIPEDTFICNVNGEKDLLIDKASLETPHMQLLALTTEEASLVSQQDLIQFDGVSYKYVDPKYIHIDCHPAKVNYQDTDSNYVTNTNIRLIFSRDITALPNACVLFPWDGTTEEKQAAVDRIKALPEIADYAEKQKRVTEAMRAYNEIARACVPGIVNRAPIELSFEGDMTVAYFFPLKKRYIGLKCPEVFKGEEGLLPSLRMDDFEYGSSVFKFLDDKHLKITGIEIVRRETALYIILQYFKFIPMILSGKYAGNTRDLIIGMIRDFVTNVSTYTIDMFMKQEKYKPGVENGIEEIIARVKAEGKINILPAPYEVIQTVVTAGDIHNKNQSIRPRKRMIRIGDKEGEKASVDELDKRYYTKAIAHAFSIFLLDDPSDEKMYRRFCAAQRIRNEKLRDEQIKALREEISEKLVFDVFGRSTESSTLRTMTNEMLKYTPIAGSVSKGLFKTLSNTLDGNLSAAFEAQLIEIKKKGCKETVAWKKCKESYDMSYTGMDRGEKLKQVLIDEEAAKEQHTKMILETYMKYFNKIAEADKSMCKKIVSNINTSSCSIREVLELPSVSELIRDKDREGSLISELEASLLKSWRIISCLRSLLGLPQCNGNPFEIIDWTKYDELMELGSL